MVTVSHVLIAATLMFSLLFAACGDDDALGEDPSTAFVHRDTLFDYPKEWMLYEDDDFLVPDGESQDAVAITFYSVGRTMPNGYDDACDYLYSEFDLTGWTECIGQWIEADTKGNYFDVSWGDERHADYTELSYLAYRYQPSNQQRRIIFVPRSGSDGYFALQFQAIPEKFDEYESTFDAIVDSLRPA